MAARLTRAQLDALGLAGETRPAGRRPRAPQRGEEGQLLAAARQYLTARGVWHQRLNAGALAVEGRRVQVGTPGTADLMLLHEGRALFVELKAAKGRQRPSQKAWQAGVEAAGCVYAVVRSLDELEAFLRRERVIE